MSYQIRYDNGFTKRYFDETKKYRKKRVWVLGVLTVLLLTMIALPKTRNFFVPGDVQVTTNAIENFADNLRQGDELDEAFYAFCREIITGAEIS